MDVTIKVSSLEVARWVDGNHFGSERLITGVSAAGSAKASDLCYATSNKNFSAKGVVLCAKPISADTYIVVPSPRAAFGIVLQHLFPEIHLPQISPRAFVHPTAVVEDGVCIYGGVWIGAECFVGSGTVIFPNVVLYPRTIVGKNCRIHAGAILGADGFSYTMSQDELIKIPQIGRLRIADNVEIGANACLDRAFLTETFIDEDTKIDNLVQVAHNVEVGKKVLMAAQVGIAGSAVIESGVQIGGQVGISDHSVVGNNAKIAAKSGVHGYLAGGKTYFGIPAQPKKIAFKILRKIRKLIND